jgi:PEP-CTERM motif
VTTHSRSSRRRSGSRIERSSGPRQKSSLDHGQFNGFFFVSDFLFQGSTHRFNDQGGAFNIRLLVNGAPTGSNLVNGAIDIGDANLTIQDYTPGQTGPQPIPEPVSLLLFGAGLAGAAMRRRAG